MRRTRVVLALLLLVFLVAGCASLGTVKRELDKPEFQRENLPLRTVKLAVLTDGSRSKECIEERVKKISDLYEKQTGTRFEISHWVKIESWKIGFYRKKLNQIAETVYPINKEFDMAVGIKSYNLFDVIMEMTIGGWQGAIDDSFRRFILIKKFTDYVSIHEIGHGFIFSKAHSSWGAMSGLLISLVPFVRPLNATSYLSREDRKEFLANKWRDFSKKPQIRDEEKVDLLDPQTEKKYLLDFGKEVITQDIIPRSLHLIFINGSTIRIDSRKEPTKISVDAFEVWSGYGKVLTATSDQKEEVVISVDSQKIWPK